MWICTTCIVASPCFAITVRSRVSFAASRTEVSLLVWFHVSEKLGPVGFLCKMWFFFVLMSCYGHKLSKETGVQIFLPLTPLWATLKILDLSGPHTYPFSPRMSTFLYALGHFTVVLLGLIKLWHFQRDCELFPVHSDYNYSDGDSLVHSVGFVWHLEAKICEKDVHFWQIMIVGI